MKKTTQQVWRESEYAQHFFSNESVHTDRALRLISGPRVLQIGDLFQDKQLADLDFPQLIKVNIEPDLNKATQLQAHYFSKPEMPSDQVVADPAFLPFDEGSLSSVILPHVLERHKLPHQVLREAHRVLRSNGNLILTGFNPVSMLGLQRIINPSAVCAGHYYPLRRVKDWLQLLGFEVVGSAVYQYAPLCSSERMNGAVNFFNSVGDRWLPMLGGSYIISAKKRDVGMRLVGRVKFKGIKKRAAKLVAARNTNHTKSK